MHVHWSLLVRMYALYACVRFWLSTMFIITSNFQFTSFSQWCWVDGFALLSFFISVCCLFLVQILSFQILSYHACPFFLLSFSKSFPRKHTYVSIHWFSSFQFFYATIIYSLPKNPLHPCILSLVQTILTDRY